MQLQFELQPNLSNDLVWLQPLQVNDFESLYKIASDPLVWEQHPIKTRYLRDVFQNFFDGAIESKGAFLVFDAQTHEAIGSSRFYDVDESTNTVLIGYTFLARSHWGGGYNKALKTVMLDHAFKFVDHVHFHIGAGNIRSQKAIEKLGAIKIDEKDVAYHGEQNNLNFIYLIEKDKWVAR